MPFIKKPKHENLAPDIIKGQVSKWSDVENFDQDVFLPAVKQLSTSEIDADGGYLAVINMIPHINNPEMKAAAQKMFPDIRGEELTHYGQIDEFIDTYSTNKDKTNFHKGELEGEEQIEESLMEAVDPSKKYDGDDVQQIVQDVGGESIDRPAGFDYNTMTDEEWAAHRRFDNLAQKFWDQSYSAEEIDKIFASHLEDYPNDAQLIGVMEDELLQLPDTMQVRKSEYEEALDEDLETLNNLTFRTRLVSRLASYFVDEVAEQVSKAKSVYDGSLMPNNEDVTDFVPGDSA